MNVNKNNDNKIVEKLCHKNSQISIYRRDKQL